MFNKHQFFRSGILFYRRLAGKCCPSCQKRFCVKDLFRRMRPRICRSPTKPMRAKSFLYISGNTRVDTSISALQKIHEPWVGIFFATTCSYALFFHQFFPICIHLLVCAKPSPAQYIRRCSARKTKTPPPQAMFWFCPSVTSPHGMRRQRT